MNHLIGLGSEADTQLRRMIRRFVVERDKVVFLNGMTLPQLEVLRKLSAEGPLKAGQLSEELDFSPGAMTALCDKLVAGEMIERRRPEEDRRTVVLSITAKGLRLLDTLRQSGQPGMHLKHLFQDFTEEELEWLQKLSTKLYRNLDLYAETMRADLAVKLEGFEDRAEAYGEKVNRT
ncbi:MarR family winged helix-turn-helix transcriptional regulator [Paenibacillus sp. S-38]|uniref:MarR family winged helix-turn-helix transcriptional regulator n=1 Tax=Paenibacillus sp. S-38 TaxID=3416710 RepID=UPI003CEEB47C